MTRIVHVSDTHFGGEDRAALEAVARFVEETAPDLVIATGDLALSGLREELEQASAWLQSLPAPAMAVPGNHDVPYYSLPGRLLDPFKRFRESLSAVRTDTWRSHDCLIAPINTARGVQWRANWAQGAISDQQIAAAEKTLQSQADHRVLKIVATHHPLDWPNDAPIHGVTHGGPAAQSRLIAAGAQVFLSGHLHVASARAIGDTGAVAVCGGTLSLRQRHEPCAFTMIERVGDALRIAIHHVAGGKTQTAAERWFSLGGRSAKSPRTATV
ncbi:MAG: metallophosphoesterase [Alphaproteobacteria bacterium]|nr:metallophosphoesterase [Alphaproteobacteria bacterium]